MWESPVQLCRAGWLEGSLARVAAVGVLRWVYASLSHTGHLCLAEPL